SSFARYRKNVYARIGGGRTRRRSRGETESCATDGRRAATFRCASVDRQASWFKATTPANQGSRRRPVAAGFLPNRIGGILAQIPPALVDERTAALNQANDLLYTEIKQRKRVEAALKQDIRERRKTQGATRQKLVLGTLETPWTRYAIRRAPIECS